MGNLQQALVCLEKRLVVSHELGAADAKAQAYGELGALHIALGNLDQALSCLEHQKNIAKSVHFSTTIQISTQSDIQPYKDAICSLRESPRENFV